MFGKLPKILLNNSMGDNHNNVREFIKPKSSEHKKQNENTLEDNGFEYVLLDQDLNGFRFNLEHLQKYAQTNRYVISLTAIRGNKPCLKNYYVDNDDLERFFKLYSEGKITGDIIEIDKYNPEVFA